jgi:hypothetical protein
MFDLPGQACYVRVKLEFLHDEIKEMKQPYSKQTYKKYTVKSGMQKIT